MFKELYMEEIIVEVATTEKIRREVQKAIKKHVVGNTLFMESLIDISDRYDGFANPKNDFDGIWNMDLSEEIIVELTKTIMSNLQINT